MHKHSSGLKLQIRLSPGSQTHIPQGDCVCSLYGQHINGDFIIHTSKAVCLFVYQCLKLVSSRVINLLLPTPCPQVEDVSFSLSHPNQYFIESQKILGGGKDPKREAEAPQRLQEVPAARAARGPAADATGSVDEMTEDLDSFFQDSWFYFPWILVLFVFIKALFFSRFTCFMLNQPPPLPPPTIASGPSQLSVSWQSGCFRDG